MSPTYSVGSGARQGDAMLEDHQGPLVSIITPSYNHAAYIRDTIESVRAQDYPNVEHIVVDGGSTDGTVAILRAYEAACPGRFRWISERDEGQSDAFNKGLAMARGQFIGWQNSDDYYYPGAFAEPIRYLSAHPDVAVVFSDCRLVDQGNASLGLFPTGSFDYARLLASNYVLNQAAFVRADALRRCGGVAQDLHYAMDYDLWIRLGMTYPMVYLPGVRGAWRILPGAKTQASNYKSLSEVAMVSERALRSPLFPTGLQDVGRAALLEHLLDAAAAALVADDGTQASLLMRKVLAYDASLTGWPYFVARLLDRSPVSTDQHFDVAIPPRALAMLDHAGLSGTSYARQMIALASVYRSSRSARAGQRWAALVQLIHALQHDRHWLRYRGTQSVLLQALLGQAMFRTLRTMVRRYGA